MYTGTSIYHIYIIFSSGVKISLFCITGICSDRLFVCNWLKQVWKRGLPFGIAKCFTGSTVLHLSLMAYLPVRQIYQYSSYIYNERYTIALF